MKTQSEMKCERPGCTQKEDRLHGYCSVYCKDMHELEMEIEELKKRIKELEAEGGN